MRLINGDENYINDFKTALDRCVGNVWLESPWGDRYNLKSEISYYLALSELLKDYGDRLELFCHNKQDEAIFLEFFNSHPDAL